MSFSENARWQDSSAPFICIETLGIKKGSEALHIKKTILPLDCRCRLKWCPLYSAQVDFIALTAKHF